MEYIKVIFLDVDGEFTYSGYDNRDTADIDINKVLLLKEIVENTRAKIVLSSSWRGFIENGKHRRPKIYQTLVSILSEYGLSIYDDLPEIIPIVTDTKKASSLTMEEMFDIEIDPTTGRAAEVHNWLSNNPDVENFVILDDENWKWNYYGYEKYWIRPSYFDINGGLLKEHVIKAINILNN